MKKQKSGLYEKSLIRIILFLCINFIHFPLYGYYFKNIGVKDGLSQPSILSIHQDELGRMWFGTLQGLSIYDGNEMITLKEVKNVLTTILKIIQFIESLKIQITIYFCVLTILWFVIN